MVEPLSAERFRVGEPGADEDEAGRGPRSWLGDDPVGRARRWLWARRWGLAVVLVGAVAGLALRWWIVGGPLGDADLDEATVGVQALQFGDGHVQAFFPNQPYGGTVEPGLVALAFRVFGASVVVLKAVPIALAALAAVLSWRVARRLGIGAVGRWCVPIVVWCGPAYAVLFSTKERGFYGVALVLAAAYPLLVLRLADQATWPNVLVFGACVGLGWWQTPLAMLVAVPCAVWLVWVRPDVWRVVPFALGAAAVAAAPWLVWNLNHHFDSLDGGASFGTTWWDRFFDWMLRMQVVTGLQTPWDAGRQLVGWRWAGLVAVVVVVVVASYRTAERAPGLLATMVAGYGLLYAVNGLAAGVGEDPRYTYLMVPALACCIGAVIPDPPRDWQRAGAALGVGALAVWSTAWGLAGTRDVAERPGANAFVASPGIEDVTRLLERRGVEYVLTDTSAMQIAFLSHRRVVGSSFGVPRILEYELAARAATPSTYVLDRGYPLNLDVMRLYLVAHDIGFEEVAVGKYRIFFLDRRVLPGEIGLFVYGGRLSSTGGISWGS
jgi:hypothetical protein